MTETTPIASFLVPTLIFLAAAVTAVPLFKLVGLGAVIGYLVAGIAIGPTGFGLITDPGTTLDISEFGVVLLLFIIGLELKPSRLIAMRRDIALIGTGQMIITGGLIAAATMPLLGLSRYAAIVTGIALAFSSTAIALQLLDERGGLQTHYGRRAFAVLLFQDMAVIPVLALMPLLGPTHMAFTNLMDELVALLHSFAGLCIVLFVGRYALNPFFRVLASTGSREVMVAAALLVVLGAAIIMGSVGMSMGLGAFLAGVMLSESNFRHQLEADIDPFRGLLMGLFFMSVGMSIDGVVVVANAGLLIMCAVALLPLKAIIVFILLRLTGSTNRGALEAAGALTPSGEFSFVVFPLAAADGLMTQPQSELLSALAALTMFAGPVLAKLLSYFLDRSETPQPELEAEKIPDDDKNSILVIGFSRFAQIALQVLLAEDVNVTVIDNSVTRIRNAARFGFKVYYGDGTRLDVLRAAGAAEALVIAVCVDQKSAGTIVELAKANFPLARVHVRAFDRIHAIKLLEQGADYQMRETFESALVFGGATLDFLLDDPDHVAEVVDFVRRRDEARFEYQLAKGSAEGLKPVPAEILPEPLFKPLKKTRALSRESQDIVEGHDVGL